MRTEEDKVSWRELIENELKENGESFTDVIARTLSDEELDARFDNRWGGTEGKPFTLWTKERVYFPGTYDGSEWVASVSRNPDGKATEHVGGG